MFLESPSLLTAVQLLFREKTFKQDMPEFSKIILLHGVYNEVFQLLKCYNRPLAGWIPTAQRPDAQENIPQHNQERNTKAMLTSWRNASLDCVDVLHWAANGIIAQLAGSEHPTVLHLHFSRVVLLVPHDSILILAASIASLSQDTRLRSVRRPKRQEVMLAEREVIEWAQRDEVSQSSYQIVPPHGLIEITALEIRITDLGPFCSTKHDWQYCTVVVSSGISADTAAGRSMSRCQYIWPRSRSGHTACTLQEHLLLFIRDPTALEPGTMIIIVTAVAALPGNQVPPMQTHQTALQLGLSLNPSQRLSDLIDQMTMRWCNFS
jgi:hypothetical protein